MEGDIYFDRLCGNSSQTDAFWSYSLSVNTSTPDLTQCFQQTLLASLPCVELWGACLFYLPYLHRLPGHYNRRSCFNVFKTVLCVLLCLVSACELLVLGVHHATQHYHSGDDYLRSALAFVTYILAAFVTRYEFDKGVHSGGVLFIFWVFSVIVNIVPFRSNILHLQDNSEGESVIEELALLILFYIGYAIMVTQFICSLFCDYNALPSYQIETDSEKQPLLSSTKLQAGLDKQNVAKDSPEKTAPVWQRISFLWITRFMFVGYKRPLIFGDLWNLMPTEQCQNITREMKKYWKIEVQRTNYRMVIKHQEDRSDKTLAHENNTKKTSSQPSIFHVLTKVFALPFILAGVMEFIYTLLQFVNPQILNVFITYINTGAAYEWQGYFLAVSLSLVMVTKSVFNQWYFWLMLRVGMRMRTAVIATVYRKSLKLSNASRIKSTVGEVVNLMSVDAQKLQDAMAYIHTLWSAPLTVVLSLYFLWQQLGPAILTGFGFMLLFVPVNALVAQQTRKIQMQQMTLKDHRLKLVNEVLNGIKVLKLYAWENFFRDKVQATRKQEVQLIKKLQYLQIFGEISWNVMPFLVALSSFATFVLASERNILDANKAFVSLSLINLMNVHLSLLPITISMTVQASVAIARINRFLRHKELDPDNVKEGNTEQGTAISVQNATFSWSSESLEKYTLKGINLSVPQSELIAVVGQVGCGKSSLISAVLGDMDLISGHVNKTGSVAYVPQQAWIQNATLQDNILFGKPLNVDMYNRVLEACALLPDLQILPGGDQTEIGEKGINLSGGQKARVSLARAVYQNSDIYLLDDPLSAVDAHVGKHIFEHVIGPTGLLKHKTRVLVTNAVTYLPQANLIICLKEGQISEMDSYENLMDHAGAFAEFIDTYQQDAEHESADDDSDNAEDKLVNGNVKTYERMLSTSSRGSGIRRRKRTCSVKSSAWSDKEIIEKEKKRVIDQRLIEEETTFSGNVKMSVYKNWIKSRGLLPSMISILCYVMFLAAQAGANIWLSEWSNDQPTANGTQDVALRNLRLGVYGAFGAAQIVAIFLLVVAMAISAVNSSRILHSKLLLNIIQAPMSFFDTTPLGRILNRFSKDIDTLDIDIPLSLRIWSTTMAVILTTLFVISFSLPMFLVVLLPLVIFYLAVQRFYVSTCRQLRRIESVRKSPIYSHFSETLSGTSSIRAYKQQERFVATSDRLTDENQMAFYPFLASNRWLSFILELIGNLLVLFTALFVVIQKDSISPGQAGLTVSYAMSMTEVLFVWVRLTSELENQVVAVERIEEFTECPKEAAAVVEGNRPWEEWPDQGRVVFTSYSTRYRPGLDLVLQDISCDIQPGEQIGVVGRTGAGKSSMTLALFRIIESAVGKIVIDGVNIASIGLHDLRSKITIIPQDPVIFSGSLRTNLDPYDQYPDREVWQALEQAHLKSYIQTLPDGLSHLCSEGGDNLSLGQRQLVCLARAILRRSKILVLDEATAAVDLETDDLIQQTIRSEFKESTVITIAHRINTIMDYDRILFLDEGKIVETGNPSQLLADSSSLFHQMASNAGIV